MHSKVQLNFVFAAGSAAILCLLIAFSSGCSNDERNMPLVAPLSTNQGLSLAKHMQQSASLGQVNLVSDLSSFAAMRIDGNLLNPWGMAVTPSGIFWISVNHAGAAVVYDSLGNAKRSPVTIPLSDSSGGGAPTGVVYNPTTFFVIPSTGTASKFIFSSEDGIISAWSSGASAKVVVDHSSTSAVYKGLALAFDGTQYFIYATNFRGGKVEAYDQQFHFDSTKVFSDPAIPAGFAPFNIQNIDGKLFVTYAKQKEPDHMDDQSGPGNGYVDIFGTDGKLLHRFASQGNLNSPWGITKAPDEGNGDAEGAVYIGNFGDGHINIFDMDGRFIRQLSDSTGQPMTIRGLWGLMFREESVQNNKPGNHFGWDKKGRHEGTGGEDTISLLYFTAGPNDESDGIFGYLQNIKQEPKHNGDDGNGKNSR